ncbi:hypothetical protein FRX31_033552 [Thalictrum thalictroides]|uniref:Uncharacterized protein n=1 Tax=Thalictrum thalictroides TaxID=46969 RepID=A0A7J6UXE8_THATH|nr:hypothetical protein FRX31_033552 [Thalictrum thalictroides]
MDNNMVVRPLWILFFVVSLVWVDGSSSGREYHGVVRRQMYVENQSISIVDGASNDVGGEVNNESNLNMGGDHEQGKNTTEISSIMSSNVGKVIGEMDKKHERKGSDGDSYVLSPCYYECHYMLTLSLCDSFKMEGSMKLI